MDGGRQLTISEKSLIPISIVGAVVALVVSGTWFVAGLRNEISGMATEIRELRTSLTERTSDAVSGQDMKVWCRLFARSNPTLQVPDWVK